MSGTIIIAENASFDIRTIDFLRIVNALRSFAATSHIATKLLENVDEFGMNMICADELSSAEFKNFAQLMREVRAVLGDDDEGVANFIEMVISKINEDGRLVH